MPIQQMTPDQEELYKKVLQAQRDYFKEVESLLDAETEADFHIKSKSALFALQLFNRKKAAFYNAAVGCESIENIPLNESKN